MSDIHTSSSDVAFTPAVKAIQTAKGSRDAYAHVEARGGWRTEVDDNLAAFLADANSLYFATASADGQPTIQHRGGPKGFLKVIDDRTIAFADFSGNKQFISAGNLTTDARVALILVDYPQQARLKILGRAETILQRRDQPRQPGRRDPEFARRRREPPEIGDGDKGLHGVDTVHGTIS